MPRKPTVSLKRLAVSILAVALALVPQKPAAAMAMELVEDTLFLSGPSMSLDDWVRYRELTRNRSFARVVLVNQSGGMVDTALGIAEDLIARRVTTVVAGYCLSACTYIFLAGERRQFAASWPLSRSRLGFHGTYDRIHGTLSGGRARVAAYFQSRLPRESHDLVIAALDRIPDRRGFLYVYHPAHRGDASLCRGSWEEKCEPVAQSNALSLGIITTDALAEISFPEKLAYRNRFLGTDMDSVELLTDSDDLARFCPPSASRCQEFARAFRDRPPERAIAFSLTGRSGASWRSDDTRRAAWRALFECARQSGELCRLAAVNDRLAAALYARFDQRSAEAVSALARVARDGLEDERFEQAELPMTRLRTDTFTGPTPERIPGAREIGTRELVSLMGRSEVALLDVWCGEETLPGAKCVFGAGLAYTDREADRKLDELFLKLFDAIAAGRTVVIFSSNSTSWLSANATFRAARAGRAVHWYRGGIEAWRKAGLPLVPSAPVGAVVP
ncbi:MAG: rhodanese-like domain-containing protein [Burkholderiales bacterium]|nr:rhodanese-like domain-containing protein [Burkholderiales bacterium]